MVAFCQTSANYLESFPAIVRCLLSPISQLVPTSPSENSSSKNTIHIDDLVRLCLLPHISSFTNLRPLCQKSRNFALNPNEGLKIRPFKNAHSPDAMNDQELYQLAAYMVHIAHSVDDFRDLKHRVSCCYYHLHYSVTDTTL